MKFFTHDTNARTNRKLRKVIRTHGATGYAIWWAILEELCATDDQGFQVEANELWLEGLAESLCLTDYRTLTRVLDTFAEIGLISAQLWADHLIYVEAIAEQRRKSVSSHIYRKHENFVFERDNFHCVYCGSEKNLTLDHQIPQSRGGSHDPRNLVTCCSTCNSSKGAKTPEEWLGGQS
jgi:hypothetical protein